MLRFAIILSTLVWIHWVVETPTKVSATAQKNALFLEG
jgi:hypothetical protein